MGWEPSGSFGALGKSAPTANAAGRRRWVGTTGDAGRNDAMKRSAVRPLSVEAVEFSPAPAPEQNVRSGRKTMSSGTGRISLTVVVESPLPTAEVHMSAPVDEEEKLIAKAIEQHVVSNTDPGKAPAILSIPLGDTLVSKQTMHSAQKIVLDGIPMEEVVCLEPLMASVADTPLDSRPMAGNKDRNSSDYVVTKKDQTSRPTEGVTSPVPSRHSVMQLHLDSQPSKYQLQPDRSRYLIPDDIPRRQEWSLLAIRQCQTFWWISM